MRLPMVHLAEMACFGDDGYTAKRGDLVRTKGGVDSTCDIEYGIRISDHERRSRESEEMDIFIELTAGE